jgi:hypothetical protein
LSELAFELEMPFEDVLIDVIGPTRAGVPASPPDPVAPVPPAAVAPPLPVELVPPLPVAEAPVVASSPAPSSPPLHAATARLANPTTANARPREAILVTTVRSVAEARRRTKRGVATAHTATRGNGRPGRANR